MQVTYINLWGVEGGQPVGSVSASPVVVGWFRALLEWQLAGDVPLHIRHQHVTMSVRWGAYSEEPAA
jgi:hypothetical protein